MDRSKKSRHQVPSGCHPSVQYFTLLKGRHDRWNENVSCRHATQTQTQLSQSVQFQPKTLDKAFLLQTNPVFKRSSERQNFRCRSHWAEEPSKQTHKETGKVNGFYILMLWCISYTTNRSVINRF
jgi:hypothetical protein